MQKTATNQSYKDSSGKPVIIEKEIGIGGEGRVCLVKGNRKVVAKLYLDKALQKGDKSGKIKAMCAIYDNELEKFSALPQKAIYDSNGKVVGFIMEYLNLNDFKEIHLLYGTKDRKKYFDYADWGFMVHSAKNLACAVETLHNKGIVIGDINESNILVDKNAMIKLIDCDSYQVEYNNKFYLCEVGKPEYTAPELQGKSFNGIRRTKNHDCFGLAVMIFQILMLAKHPYTGINAPHDRGEAIEKGYYCFGSNSIQPNPNSAQWYYSQLFSTLNYEVKELFERAFTSNSRRPTAKEWINALDKLERDLHSCTINNKHKYYGSSCIWCKLEKRGFRPFDTSASSYSQYSSTTYQQTPYTMQTNYATSKQPKQKKNPPNQAKTAYKQQARQQRINAKNQQTQVNTANTQNYGTTHTYPSYKRNVQSQSINIWHIIGGIIFCIAFIGTFIPKEDTTKPVNNTVQEKTIPIPEQVEEQQKIYTEAEKQADIKAYKEKFIAKVKSHWQPQYESFLIDHNGSLLVKVDKEGNISFPEFDEIGYSNANTNAMKYAVESGLPYNKLPESYNEDYLTFRIYFEGNEDLYWGRTKQAKQSYQVSLSPIKQTSPKTSATQQKQPANKINSQQNKNSTTKYKDPNAYLSAVNKLLKEDEYHKNHPMTCTASVTPPNEVKITKFTQNCDIAFHLLSTMNIPQFKDSNGYTVPLIVKFSGNSTPVATFQYQPQISKPIQKVNTTTNSKAQSKQATVNKTTINKPKTDLEKSTDYFFE